jgi:hypothetical protein
VSCAPGNIKGIFLSLQSVFSFYLHQKISQFYNDNELTKPEQPFTLMEEHTLKFLVDHMLGKLAKYLRMMDVDTVYFTQTDVSTLIEKACKEKRIILSRNAKLKHIDGFSDFFF